MKKTIIGASLLASGTILSSGIIISGAINFSWSLWSSIKSLSLTIPFIVSVVFALVGLIILILQYFNTNLKTLVEELNKWGERGNI